MTVPASYETDREEIASVSSKERLVKAFRRRTESSSEQFLYLMFAAVVIGIAVMYNLGILSFTEKTRDIATLKVLGFPTKKIRWILQQQNIVVTGLATLVGLPLGKQLLVFVMEQLDDEADFLYSELSLRPYLLSFLLSFVLSLVVNALISSKIKDINMVEALKGVE